MVSRKPDETISVIEEAARVAATNGVGEEKQPRKTVDVEDEEKAGPELGESANNGGADGMRSVIRYQSVARGLRRVYSCISHLSPFPHLFPCCHVQVRPPVLRRDLHCHHPCPGGRCRRQG